MARERTKFEKLLDRAKRTSDRLNQFGIDRPVLPTLSEYDAMSKSQKLSTIRTLKEYVRKAPSNFALKASEKYGTWQSQERAAQRSKKMTQTTIKNSDNYTTTYGNQFSEMLRRVTRKLSVQVVNDGWGVHNNYVLKIRRRIEKVVDEYGANFANLLAQYILDNWSMVESFVWEYDSYQTGESLGVSEFIELIDIFIKDVEKEYSERT